MDLGYWSKWHIEKDIKNNLYWLRVTPTGLKNDSPHSINWDYIVEWTADCHDVDEFAVIYKAILELRKRYPYIYFIDEYGSFSELSFEPLDLPNMELILNYGFSQHGDIEERKYTLKSRIISLGIDNDIYPFAKYLWSHIVSSEFDILMSNKEYSLNYLKEKIELIQSVEGYKKFLVEEFGICLFFNYSEGWIDIITKDRQLIEAFLRNPPPDKYFRLKQALIHINVMDNWLLEKGIDFDPTPNYMKIPKLIKNGAIDIKKRNINWQDLKLKEKKQYEKISDYIFAIVGNYQFEIDRVLGRFQD